MRLIVGEFYKLFSKRVFTICIVISLFANAFFLVYTQSANTVNQAIINNKIEYEKLLDECLQQENPEKFINSKKKEVQIAVILNHISDDSEYTNQQILKYKHENPLEYENALKLNLSQKQLESRLIMIQDILTQIEYIEEYDEFILNMESRADSQKLFSVFAKPDSFSYKNIEKTPRDFNQLKNIRLDMGNNNAIEIATQFQLTDYLILVLVILICIFLFSIEREKGLYPLVRSTTKGRSVTIYSKLLVVTITVTVICFVYYVSNFVISGVLFGFGDLARNIQSSKIYMNCSLDLSIFEYLCLWIIGKIMLFCVFALVLSFVFIGIKTTAKVYALIVAFLFTEFFLYLFIDNNSILSIFKYVNFIYLMTCNNIFGNYTNVNFFNIPINIITVFFVITVFAVIVGSIGSSLVFSKTPQVEVKSIILTKVSKFTAKHSKIKGSVSIFSGEAFKHYKTSFVCVVLAALFLFGYSNLTDDLSIIFSGVEESAYNEYMHFLEGELDIEKYNFIESEQKYFDDLIVKQREIMNDESLSESEKEQKLLSIQSIFDGKGKAFSRVKEQISYSQMKSEVLCKSPALINEIVCKRLTQDTFREWQYFTLLLIVVVFCASNIFACEYKNSMLNLIRANKHGKTKLILTKLFIVLLTTVISFVLIYLPYFINFVQTFGTSSLDLPIAFTSDFSMLTSSVTVFEYVCILGMVHFVIAIASTVFIYMMSLFLKNNATTMIVSSGILIVPCVVVMRMNEIRMMWAFKNDVWIAVIIAILVICLCTIIMSLIITVKKFNNVLWRKKDACP